MRTATHDWLGGPRPPQAVTPLASLAPRGVPGLREGLQLVLRQAFGSPVAGDGDPAAAPTDRDAGICGPGSVSWRLMAEPAAIVGGIRALLLQALHPLAVAGVAEHSAFRDDPLGRLQTTAMWITTATFGPTATTLRMAAVVRAAHRRVRGTAPDGRRYAASDPELLAWVSVAFTASLLASDRLWAPHPVTGAEADRFVAEQARMAALLDERLDLAALRRDPEAGAALRADAVELPLLDQLPTDVAGLLDRMEAFAPRMASTAEAREIARFLQWPPGPPALRAAYLPIFAGAAGALPGWQRRMLGLPSDRWSARLAVANAATIVTFMRSTLGVSPAYDAATARLQPAA